MSRKRATHRAESGDDFGFLAPEAPDQESDLFNELTAGAMDDPDAIELTDGEKANLGVCYATVAALTRKKKALEAEVSKVSEALIEAKGSMLDAMKGQGTKQFKGTGDDGACSMGSRYETKVTDPEAFLRWVMVQHPELLTVNAQSRTSFIRQNYKDKGVPVGSDEFPPGIEATEREFLQVRGVKELQHGGSDT